ncbi:NACHT domain-containing protein [Singulisphaera sp. GP187]|nr:NACHT domain-containing protein [Singulisphaera sp. GP187]
MVGSLLAGFSLTASGSFKEMLAIELVGRMGAFGWKFPSVQANESLFLNYVLFCSGIVALALFWVWRPRQAITNPVGRDVADRGRDERLSKEDFRRALSRYCGSLVDYLNNYDREVNWSDRDYSPLEAEVETEVSGRLRPKVVVNLVEAVRRDRGSQTFVVIGDPGSGKSVSLRNLVRCLSSEAEHTGVVPVYVNLREFPAGVQISVNGLVQFARESVRLQTGRDGEAFLNGWYEDFRLRGKLFFVIDSFDEMPQILDADERSDAHKNICLQFDRLFTQEIRACRKVLASREYRSPLNVQGARLVIRPLTEKQVRRVVGSRVLGRGFDPNEFVRRVFRERPELASLLRNPFTAELLTDFARDRNGELPSCMFDIFNAYVNSRLINDEPMLIERSNVSASEVRKAAQQLALAIFTDNRGLETSAAWAVTFLDQDFEGQGQSLVDGLKYARLARVGGHGRVAFSFAHRRFAEFFAVEAMQSSGRPAPLEQIPTDSRWRDGLVMYCGVAAEQERVRVAEFCWERILQQSPALASGQVEEAREAIHCLRFLVAAFQSDTIPVAKFNSKLGLMLRRILKKQSFSGHARPNCTLASKLAAEAIPLVDGQNQQRAILQAMGNRSLWVQETTVDACRNLPSLSEVTAKSVRTFYRMKPILEKVQNFADLDFALSLSEAFRPIRLAYWGDILEGVLLALIAIVLTIAIIRSAHLACNFSEFSPPAISGIR